ncbi:hypothetical protein CW731_13265 [Polaribacter sp. ALD11]|uniref:hypothetical protein n=1 Tax=Polaribacter sp. ALD11 TaxID=2058137 RepID=UPI000C3145D5|nr:hypothetical protein [Polaribacter sp. ALD11]AUC86187.1 hypothetical protein CW731_13265 [Polaribacter sp. ALD11]
MKRRTLFLMIVLLVSISFHAQKTELPQQKVPVSIYTFNSLDKDVNSISSLNKRLNLTTYKFVTIAANDIENNIASINFSDVGKKPSAYIYDDYKKYQNNNLLKGFLLKNDPTRWNLHRIENRIQPYFLNQK